MPTYLYRCEKGHEREVFHAMQDAPVIMCVECSGQMWKKPVLSTVKWSCFIQPSPAVSEYLNDIPRMREEAEEKGK